MARAAGWKGFIRVCVPRNGETDLVSREKEKGKGKGKKRKEGKRNGFKSKKERLVTGN